MFKSWLGDYAVKNRFLDAAVIIRFLWCDWLEKILKIIKNAKISLVMYDIAQFYFFITKCSVCCSYEKTLSVTCMHLLGVSLRVPYWMCWTELTSTFQSQKLWPRLSWWPWHCLRGFFERNRKGVQSCFDDSLNS